MKLIDVDLLNEEVSKEYKEQKQLYEEIGYKERFGVVRGLGKASQIIAKQPIVDAVPVVLCRDCLYRSQYADEEKRYECGAMDLHLVSGDFFCAMGERRKQK